VCGKIIITWHLVVPIEDIRGMLQIGFYNALAGELELWINGGLDGSRNRKKTCSIKHTDFQIALGKSFGVQDGL
jgi:hypothetical protein